MNIRRAILTGIALIAGGLSAEQGAKYLVIAYDPYVPILQPLVRWKTKKGVPAKIVPVSQAGTTPAQIRTYIRNAYNNWPIKPEYVLLAGSPSQIPSYNNTTDCYYGDMGGDYQMEISVGRFFATNARECSILVAKTLAYERQTIRSDTIWFLKASTCVREDNNPDDTIYWGDSRVLHQFCQSAGYVHIDSFSSNRGNSSADVTAAANEGRGFITYRGQGVGSWWAPFNTIDPFNWTNGEKMPVVVGATCATISLSPGESMYGDKFIRAGSPSGLGGAIAYFGTTGIVSGGAHFRSACYRGFFTAIFGEKQNRLGPATLRGRFWVDSLYHNQTRYQEWNLLGDPELCLWTDIPKRIEVSYDSVIQMVPQRQQVLVTASGQPVTGAQVCASMDSSVYVTSLTNDSGYAELDINPVHIGIMDVVVTGRNILPFEGNCRVVADSAPYLIVAGTEIDDFGGNNDSIINPGERVRVYLNLRNVGGVTAFGVDGVWHISSLPGAVLDSTAFFGTIEPDSVCTGDPLELIVDSLNQDSTVITGMFAVRDLAGDSWSLPLDLLIRAGRIVADSLIFTDSPPGGNGNGRLGKLESGRLRLPVRNSGGGDLNGVVLKLTCDDSNLVITDSLAYYGRIAAGECKTGEIDRFAISAGPGLSTTSPVRLTVRVYGDGGTYYYNETLNLNLAVETGTVTDPIGPDSYGYWCYDDTDTASGRAPGFEWFELAPPGPGEIIPAVSDSDAATRRVRLPFAFKYYGFTDTLISVCSNGFITLGYTTYRYGNNRPIPDSAGPPLMIAPFWDDLNPDETSNGYGTAYQYYDTVQHRFIIEFREFAHYNQPNIRETFQVILYDPYYYPTPTGDGEVLFLYQRVQLNSSCTVGIEDATETVGIQYLFNNSYHPNAAYLQSGRAVKYTTTPPRLIQRPWLMVVVILVSDTAYGNSNGFPEPGETLEVSVAIQNRGITPAANTVAILSSADGDAVIYDSVAAFGTINPGAQANNFATPFLIRIAQSPDDTIADFRILITADDYTTAGYFSIGIFGLTAVNESSPRTSNYTRLEKITPNPVVNSAIVRYSLAEKGAVDLALFDISGRKVKTIVHGCQVPGVYESIVSLSDLVEGVYFCRLTVPGGNGEKRFIQKMVYAK
ncbi:MAG: C25 family cysteine peptidase [candidate division WOR-3 bacterium]